MPVSYNNRLSYLDGYGRAENPLVSIQRSYQPRSETPGYLVAQQEMFGNQSGRNLSGMTPQQPVMSGGQQQESQQPQVNPLTLLNAQRTFMGAGQSGAAGGTAAPAAAPAGTATAAAPTAAAAPVGAGAAGGAGATAGAGAGAGAAGAGGAAAAPVAAGGAGGAGAAGGAGGAAAMGGLGAAGVAGLAVLGIGGGKMLEERNSQNPVGRALLSGLGPSSAQMKQDPKLALTTALGVPFLNGWIRSDKAASQSPEWGGIFS